MNEIKQFYTSEEAASDILRQLDEDVDCDTELEENEITGEANIVELVMDGIVPESSINNIDQRNEETSDESEDGCFEKGNNDDEATIITMYKSRDGTVWSKISFSSSQERRCVENIVSAQSGATKFIHNHVDTSTDVFQELLGMSSQKYTVAEAKRQGNNNFELSIDELKAFLRLCIIRGVIKGRDEPLCSF